MRTHWGYATILCRHCKEAQTVLIIAAHQREGIGCHHCFRKAATPGEVQALIAEVEERDGAREANGDEAA